MKTIKSSSHSLEANSQNLSNKSSKSLHKRMVLVIYLFLSVAALHKGLGTVGPVLLPFVVLLLQEAKAKLNL
jgi:hypothetical protein